MRPIRRTARAAIALLAMCAAMMLGGVAGATPMPSHGDDHWQYQTFELWCAHLQAVWQRSIPGCPPPAHTTTTTWAPPTTTTTRPTPTTTTTSTSTTTSTTRPSLTPATIADPPDATPIDVPDNAESLSASPSDVGSSVPSRVSVPVTEIVAAPILPPGLPAAVPGLEQPEVPPAASFEDDVLLPGSMALVIAVAGLAAAFLVYQGAAGRRGPRGPTGPIDDGETLEFR